MRGWVKLHAVNLYQTLMMARENKNNFGFFRDIIRGQLNSLMQDVEAIKNQTAVRALRTNEYFVIAGNNNEMDPFLLPRPNANYISVVGNNSSVKGNQIISGGYALNTTGKNNFVYGNNVSLLGSNSVVIGQNRSILSNDILVLGNFFLDISRFKAGKNFIQYVPEGTNPVAAPYL